MVRSSDFDSENLGSNPGAATKIVEAYEALIDRAIQACAPGCGFYSSVGHDDWPRLRIEGDKAILFWREYETDYYGGGYNRDESASVPVELLYLGEDDFQKWQQKTEKEIAEREAKVRAAQQVIARERQEAHERAMYAALRAKYGPLKD